MQALKFTFLLVGFGCCAIVAFSQVPQHKPQNIVLIVADDLGYADLGCYGGDIETPNLDALAKQGMRFSQFHAAPLCAVTRAMLLSGNNNHIAGMGRQDRKTAVEGYEGYLSDRIVPFPLLLQQAGYHTYMAGKWHLGTRPQDGPLHKGFEHSFVTLEGGANHYSGKGIFVETPESVYIEDGQPAAWKGGDYSTDFYTDKLMAYIDRNKHDARPFFVYAAYTSPHWPLQVDEKYWRKYEGRYDEGYEVLRQRRLESLKQAGMVEADHQLPALNPRVRPWNSLTKAEKKWEARKMELYAGMVHNLDENIGRLIRYLKQIGQYDNTLFVFMSDNGAAAEDFYYHDHFGPFLRQHYTDAYEKMGGPGSFISYGPQWAEAGSAPFRYFKGYTTEGGMIAPMIISGAAVTSSGSISHAFCTIMDLAPTFLEKAGIPYPAAFNGKKAHPLRGASLNALLAGAKQNIHDEHYVFGIEHEGYVMVRKGPWKLVNIIRPFDPVNFALYHLEKDPVEAQDLRARYPEKFQEMLKEWENFSKEVKVKMPTPVQGEGFD
ncbi:MAG TPA: arylsulfatase [Phnomibacter sp.]|nr:arylsulfatase [Phnomibacter sp.]